MKYEEFKSKMLENPEVKKEYDALASEYELVSQLIKARQEKHLTQKELAEKVGTKQASIARLESGNYNPTFNFLQKIAAALGKKISFSLK